MQYPTGCYGVSSCTTLPCGILGNMCTQCIIDDAMPSGLLWLPFMLMIMHEFVIHHELCIPMQNFFKTFAPNESAPYGIQPEVMDTYVKSCGEF